MQIYMIRHGRQCSNLCNVDVELSEEGHRQAQLVAKRLKNYNIEGLYSSVLTRAQQTAEHISKELALPIITVEHIEEIHFGDWTGKSDAQLDAEFPEDRKAYKEGLYDVTYQNGESGETCFARYKEGIQRIIEEAAEKNYENIAVVTHGIAMRAFMCGVLGIPFAKRGILSRQLENGSLNQFGYENGIFTLERFNDYSHIEPYDELLRKHFK